MKEVIKKEWNMYFTYGEKSESINYILGKWCKIFKKVK